MKSFCIDSYEEIHQALVYNPYELYSYLQGIGPVCFSKAFFQGAWLLSSYEDVCWALKTPAFSASRVGGWLRIFKDITKKRCTDSLATGLESCRQKTLNEEVVANSMPSSRKLPHTEWFRSLFSRVLLFLDAPDHTRIRNILMPAFQKNAIGVLRNSIQTQVQMLLDEVDLAKPFDFMKQVAFPLPARMMIILLGIKSVSPEKIFFLSQPIAYFLGQLQPNWEVNRRAEDALANMVELFREEISWREKKQCSPGTDLLSLLIAAKERREIVSNEELLAQCVMLLFSGYETTSYFLGNAVHALLQNGIKDNLFGKLRANVKLVPFVLRELLRYDSPVQYSGRRVLRNCLVHGKQFNRGDLVIPLIGAANRDPKVYQDPDVINFQRKGPAPLSFGHGSHVCIGAALTLLEAEVVLCAMLDRWPKLFLDSGPPLDRIPNPLYRGFKSLWLTTNYF